MAKRRAVEKWAGQASLVAICTVLGVLLVVQLRTQQVARVEVAVRHLDVFREFLDHLDRAGRRKNPPRTTKAAKGRAKRSGKR